MRARDFFIREKAEIWALMVLLLTVNRRLAGLEPPCPASGWGDIRWMVSPGYVWLLVGKVRISAFERRIERARARALCADRARSFAWPCPPRRLCRRPGAWKMAHPGRPNPCFMHHTHAALPSESPLDFDGRGWTALTPFLN